MHKQSATHTHIIQIYLHTHLKRILHLRRHIYKRTATYRNVIFVRRNSSHVRANWSLAVDLRLRTKFPWLCVHLLLFSRCGLFFETGGFWTRISGRRNPGIVPSVLATTWFVRTSMLFDSFGLLSHVLITFCRLWSYDISVVVEGNKETETRETLRFVWLCSRRKGDNGRTFK